MLSRYSVSKKPFDLKSYRKSKFFELSRYFIPIKSIRTSQVATFFIELFSINPTINTKCLQFGSITEKKNKAKKASYIFIRFGILGKRDSIGHLFFPSQDILYDKKNKILQLGPFVFSEKNVSASFSFQFHQIEWNIAIKNTEEHGYYLSNYLQLDDKERQKTKVFNRNVFQNFSGKISIDSERFAVLENTQLSFFNKSWGKLFLQPSLMLASQSFISLISGKKLKNSLFLSASFYNYTRRKYEHFLVLGCNGQKFRFKSKDIQIQIYPKEELVQSALSAENSIYLIDIDMYSQVSEMSKLGYDFKDSKDPLPSHLFVLGSNAYGELRVYKKNKKKLEIIEQIRIENCFCEYSPNLSLEK